MTHIQKVTFLVPVGEVLVLLPLSVDHTKFHTSTKAVYTRTELLQVNNKSVCNGRLPQAAWRTILSLGIERDQFIKPTSRGIHGIRAAFQAKQKRAARIISKTLPKPPPTGTRHCNFLNVCHWNAKSVRNKTTTSADHNIDVISPIHG